MSQVEVDKIIPQSGTTLTIGDSGDTIAIASGATLSGSISGITNLTMSGDLTVDTDTLYVDSTNNKVGIGTNTPNYLLDVEGTGFQFRINSTSGDANIQLKVPDTTSLAYINFGDSTSINSGQIMYRNNGDSMAFSTNGSEAMRINSSGNLLVGKTSQSFDNVGVENRGDGLAIFTRDGNTPVIINRKTSDGTVIDIKKDGTTVGNISVSASDNLQVFANSTSHTGLEFGNQIIPMTTGATSDNSVQLGTSSKRFSDLYLGGGLYVGGTGSANYLDDYEKGTWTPSLSTTVNGFLGDPTPSSTEGKYTKIGKLVYLTGKIIFDSSQSHTEYSYIDGLPFATSTQQAGGVYNTQGAADGNATGFVRVGLSSNRCSLVENDVAIGGNTIFIFNVTYIAD